MTSSQCPLFKLIDDEENSNPTQKLMNARQVVKLPVLQFYVLAKNLCPLLNSPIAFGLYLSPTKNNVDNALELGVLHF